MKHLARLMSSRQKKQVWQSEIQSCCRAKFANPQETVNVQRQRIQQYRHLAHTSAEAPPALDVAIVIRARARMSQGKVSGDDSFVAEMLKELPMIAVYLTSHIFSQRYLDQDSVSIQAWATIILVFIPKGTRAGQVVLDMLGTHDGTEAKAAVMEISVSWRPVSYTHLRAHETSAHL
eukprot:7356045-Alexandrium_andersonii.AAC.1